MSSCLTCGRLSSWCVPVPVQQLCTMSPRHKRRGEDGEYCMMKSFVRSPMRNIVGQMPDTIQAIQHLGIVAMMSTCVSSTSTWTNHSSARAVSANHSSP